MSKARDLADLLDSSGDVKSAKLDNVPTYSDVTDTASGLMKKDHKIKLAGIETSANNYVHPTGAGAKHIPTGGSVEQILVNSASGTATWQDNNRATTGKAIAMAMVFG
jgi:hypothetical protein